MKKRIVLGFFKDMRKGDQSRMDRWVCGWIGRWREVGIGRWLVNFRELFHCIIIARGSE